MKKCLQCDLYKELFEFYAHAAMADGHLNKCKECVRKRVKKHRIANIDKIQEYDRQRPNHEERISLNREYFKTEKGRIKKLETANNYKAKYPEREAARIMVNNKVRDGYILKMPCEKCGDTKSEAHHDDYSRPLDVRWLCDFHHKEYHKEKRKQERELSLNRSIK